MIAYCVMSNHYHMLMSAADPAAVSPGMRELNGGYARTYNKRYGRDAHVFRNRFAAHPIETDEHLLAAARYVVLNPVRAGICSRPGDWRWSSYRPTAGLAPKPSFLSVERLLGAIDPRAEVARAIYRRMVADAVSDTVTNV